MKQFIFLLIVLAQTFFASAQGNERILVVKPLNTVTGTAETSWGGSNARYDDRYVLTKVEGGDNLYTCSLPLNVGSYSYQVVYRDTYAGSSDAVILDENNNPKTFRIYENGTRVTFYARLVKDGDFLHDPERYPGRIRSVCDAQITQLEGTGLVGGYANLGPAIGKSFASKVVHLTGGNKLEFILGSNTAGLGWQDYQSESRIHKYPIWTKGRHVLRLDFPPIFYKMYKVLDELKNPTLTLTENPWSFTGSVDGSVVTDNGTTIAVSTVEANLYYAIIPAGNTQATEVKLPLTTSSRGAQTAVTWRSEPVDLTNNLPDGDYTLHVRYETVCESDTLTLDNGGEGYTASFTVAGSPFSAIRPVSSRAVVEVENGVIHAAFAGQAWVKLYSVTGQLINQTPADGDYTHAVGRGVYLLSIEGKTYKVVVK